MGDRSGLGAESWRSNEFAWAQLPADCDWKAAGELLRITASKYCGYSMYAFRGQQARIGLSPGAFNAEFRAVPGLAGTGVNLESITYPEYYLRHSNSALCLQRSDAVAFDRRPGDLLFRADATSTPTGLSQDSSGAPVLTTPFRLESWNFPGRCVRHYLGGVELGTTASRPETPFRQHSRFLEVT